MMACGVAVDVLFGALGSELFPTSYRSTASGVRSAVGTVGGSAGLWLEGWLYPMAGSHAEAITWMLGLAWIAPVVVLLLLPETARRELEDIAPSPSPDERGWRHENSATQWEWRSSSRRRSRSRRRRCCCSGCSACGCATPASSTSGGGRASRRSRPSASRSDPAAIPRRGKLVRGAARPLWGLRLGAYLFWRNAGKGEDYRYQAMRRRHGARFGA